MTRPSQALLRVVEAEPQLPVDAMLPQCQAHMLTAVRGLRMDAWHGATGLGARHAVPRHLQAGADSAYQLGTVG